MGIIIIDYFFKLFTHVIQNSVDINNKYDNISKQMGVWEDGLFN